jgi:hypothetical protein
MKKFPEPQRNPPRPAAERRFAVPVATELQRYPERPHQEEVIPVAPEIPATSRQKRRRPQVTTEAAPKTRVRGTQRSRIQAQAAKLQPVVEETKPELCHQIPEFVTDLLKYVSDAYYLRTTRLKGGHSSSSG